jgi:hypothetical protein
MDRRPINAGLHSNEGFATAKDLAKGAALRLNGSTHGFSFVVRAHPAA